MRVLHCLLLVGLLCSVLSARAEEPKPPVCFALVGCAHIHTPSFISLLKFREADVKLKYVWDHDVARARKNAETVGAEVVEDVSKIWNDPEIKAVVILSETSRHEELVLAAAKARKHLFVEKPLGIGSRDAYAMMQAVEEAGVLFQMGYTRRGEGRVQFIREQIKAGNFGKITRIRASTAHGGALEGMFDQEFAWTVDPRQTGVGGFGDIGTHSLDLLLYLMGDIESATAALSTGSGRYTTVDEGGEGLLRFKDGTIGTVAGSWADFSDPITLEICGTEGHAWFLKDYVYFQSAKVEGANGFKPQGKVPKAWANVLDLFIDAVLGQPDLPLVTIREAAYRSAVMEAMYQGAREGKWVAPQPPPAKK